MKKNKLLIAILLVVSGLLGVAAVITAYIYSNIEDINPTPSGADIGQNTCDNIYLELEDIDAGDRKRLGRDDIVTAAYPLIVGAQYTYKKPSTESTTSPKFTLFEFTINTEHKFVVDFDDDTKKETKGNSVVLYPEFTFSDFSIFDDTEDTITIAVKAFGVGLDGETVEELTVGRQCLPAIYSLDKSASIPIRPDICLEAGETATDYCADLEEGDVCLIPAPPCCTGLVRVDTCATPDSQNQCTREIPNCYICLNDPKDGVCGIGENICNSSDCAASTDPIEEPDPTPEPPPQPTPDPTPDPIPNPIPDPIPDPNEDPIVDPPSLETSDFIVSKNGPACVERVAPSNEATFTIRIENKDDTYEDLLQIVDKLPLGFIYVAGSTIINGTPDVSDTFSSVANTGNTQEIIWSRDSGWSLAPSGSMTIQFRATAGQNALSGDVLNEVVITPKNNPIDTSNLRTEYEFTVAQNCTTPQTSIMGNVPMKATFGILAILLAFYFYSSNAGLRVSESIVGKGSKVTDKVESGFLKVTEPRKYFERKFRDGEDR